MLIKSKNIEIVSVDKIIQNPKNPNKHPVEQVERLVKLIKNTGFRSPLIVSKRSGFLVVGHGRLMAAMKLKMESVPVIYQDFESEAEEYAYMVADNATSSWSDLDLDLIKTESLELPDFDIDMLGLKNFQICEMAEEEDGDEVETGKKFSLQVDLPNELEMRDLYDDLISKGYMVKEL